MHRVARRDNDTYEWLGSFADKRLNGWYLVNNRPGEVRLRAMHPGLIEELHKVAEWVGNEQFEKMAAVPGEPWRYSDPLLNERGKTHGNSKEQFRTAQNLKMVLRDGPNWPKPDYLPLMTHQMCESLELIATKMSRIVHGDPKHIDAWDDITGYAKLVSETLKHENDSSGSGQVAQAAAPTPRGERLITLRDEIALAVATLESCSKRHRAAELEHAWGAYFATTVYIDSGPQASQADDSWGSTGRDRGTARSPLRGRFGPGTDEDAIPSGDQTK